MKKNSPILGVWSGCAFPTQETTLIFCEDGRGLMFFYWGSCAESPFVDEFYWQIQSENQILVEWISKHEYDYDKGIDTLIITSGQNEAISFEIIDKTSLKIELGMHYAFDSLLDFSRKPQAFESEKEQISKFAEEFNPFSPDRLIWTQNDQNWQKLSQDLPKKQQKPWWKFW